MKLYLLFFLFSFVSTQSYEKFIKVAVGPTTIKCNDNDVFVTNATKYLRCNQGNYCDIRDHKVLYVCVKEKFLKSNCQILQKGAIIFKKGCFVSNNMYNITFKITPKSTQFFHFVVLEMSLGYKELDSSRKYCTAFCDQRLDQTFRMSLHKKVWILYKVSNNSKEDFREFFSNDPPRTSPPSREESDDTIIIEDSSFATKESEDTTTIEDSSTATKEPDGTTATEDSLSLFKESNDTATIEYTSSATKEPNDPGPIEDSPSVTKVILIPVAVVAALVVILLIIFLVVAYFFYRKNLPKTKTTEHSKEIPPSENETFNQIPSGRELDILVDNILYEIPQSDERSQPETPISPSQKNKPEQSCEGDLYANVTNQEDGGPVVAGDSSHIVVNGDLYATVNKDESYSDNSARLEDNLVREEVNGEMYTVVQKPYLAI